MKKYKLIKKVPNCQVGDIAYLDSDGVWTWESDNSRLPEGWNPAELTEFFEVEKEDVILVHTLKNGMFNVYEFNFGEEVKYLPNDITSFEFRGVKYYPFIVSTGTVTVPAEPNPLISKPYQPYWVWPPSITPYNPYDPPYRVTCITN